MTLDPVGDSRRERFRPSQAASGLEQATERGGQSWLITVHSAALYTWGVAFHRLPAPLERWGLANPQGS
jgi:hypothetical protein